MNERVHIGALQVSRKLYDFVNQEALAGLNVSATDWNGFVTIINRFAPQNAELLARRDELQARIDAWHRANRGSHFDRQKYRRFLQDIGYLSTSDSDCQIATLHVDDEIARIAGPQLVVPVNNARYALNAANARWGSLYDALYGTDAIAGKPIPGDNYDAQRGSRVIAYVRSFYD